jgi:hypothetical protein
LLELHVLACFNPCFEPGLENFRPSRKIPQAQKNSHTRKFSVPRRSRRTRAATPPGQLPALGEHSHGGPPRRPGLGGEPSEPGGRVAVLRVGGCRGNVLVYMRAGLKTAAGAMRQTALWHDRAPRHLQLRAYFTNVADSPRPSALKTKVFHTCTFRLTERTFRKQN